MCAPMSRPANFTSLARGPNVQKDRRPIRCCICRSGGLVGLVRAAKVNRACPSAQRRCMALHLADWIAEARGAGIGGGAGATTNGAVTAASSRHVAAAAPMPAAASGNGNPKPSQQAKGEKTWGIITAMNIRPKLFTRKELKPRGLGSIAY